MKRDEYMNRIQKKSLFFCLILSFLLTGCQTVGHAHEATFESAFENGQEEPVDIYVSAATVVFKGVDRENQVIEVFMMDKKEDRTLFYDGATTIADQYGAPMSMEQLCAGSILNIAYNSELEKVGSIQISPEAFQYQDIQKYTLDINAGNASIGQELYQLDKNLLVFSDSEEITPDQIVNQDVLSFQGIGHEIKSISIKKGHGYLELENEELFVGGWIEVGQSVISQIAQDMLFTVPEGTYQVRLTAAGLEEFRDVTITRNEITEIDLGDIEKPIPESGNVAFDITPADAVVSIDDHIINQSYILKLPLGIHQITVSASGYDTISKFFEVDGEPLTVQMSLTKETSTVSGNDVSWASDKKSSGSITVQAPSGVEVYEDNLFKGYAPVTYDKTSGTHVLTLRKAGYKTRSYTIEVSSDNEDLVYSFPDLEPENESTVSGNTLSDDKNTKKTVSGNTISGNTVSENSLSKK